MSSDILHFKAETGEKEGRLPGSTKNKTKQYNILKLPYYVLSIPGWVPIQIEQCQKWKLFKSLNILYPMILLTFLTILYAIQIAAISRGKTRFDLPFSTYFLLAIHVFEFLCGTSCVYLSRRYKLFNLLQQTQLSECSKTNTKHGMLILLTIICSMMMPIYNTAKVMQQWKTSHRKFIEMLCKKYYDFLPNLDLCNVIVSAFKVMERTLFLTLLLAMSSIIAGVCLHTEQKFKCCNNFLLNLIKTKEIYLSPNGFAEFEDKFSVISKFVQKLDRMFKYIIAIVSTEVLLELCYVQYIIAAECARSDVIVTVAICLYILILTLIPAVLLKETVST